MDCIVHGITKYGPSTLIPGLGRTPREGSASGVLLVALEWLPTPVLQCSGLENSMGCIVHGTGKVPRDTQTTQTDYSAIKKNEILPFVAT